MVSLKSALNLEIIMVSSEHETGLAYLLVYLPSHTLCPYFRLMCSVIKFINNDYSKLRITLRISVVMVMVAAAAAAVK